MVAGCFENCEKIQRFGRSFKCFYHFQEVCYCQYKDEGQPKIEFLVKLYNTFEREIHKKKILVQLELAFIIHYFAKTNCSEQKKKKKKKKKNQS